MIVEDNNVCGWWVVMLVVGGKILSINDEVGVEGGNDEVEHNLNDDVVDDLVGVAGVVVFGVFHSCFKAAELSPILLPFRRSF